MEQMISAPLPNGRPGMRVKPKMAPGAYRSFEVRSPLATHFRDASCKEARCEHYLNGWVSEIDVSTQQGKVWAAAIKRSGRAYTVDRSGPGPVITFRFEAGQRCFAAPHKVPVGRPELFVVRDGDWRGNPSGNSARVRPPEFVERMAENLDALDSALRRG
jgi:hypothetical protein